MTVTLITGANKGIGFATARRLVDLGHRVYVGARDAERGEKAAAELGARFVQLDVTDDASVDAALATLTEAEGHLDVLVNNAGVMDTAPDPDGPTALHVFDVNAVGIVRVTHAALPLLHRAERPVVVNVSSSMGSFWAGTNPDRPESGILAPLYAASKAAATMLTLQYAKANPAITFNAVEPGFTATDMTTEMDGGRPVDESARVIAALVTAGPAAPSGTLLDESGVLPW